MNKKTVKDIDVKGKLVFVRCDFNVPLNDDGTIADTTRVDSSIPTIKYLQDNGAKIILASHLGRPKGQVKKEFSMKPVAEELSKKLNTTVKLAEDVTGVSANEIAKNLREGEIELIENLRFDPREEKNEDSFCTELANLGTGIEVYVNDAFGTAHRAHSSTEGITKYIKGDKVAGFLMEKELNFLGKTLEAPARPFVAILGGAKVSDKIGVIDSLLEKVDILMIGGGMSYTFTKAQGYNVGNSICETDKVDLALDCMQKAKDRGVKLVLPIDIKVGKEFKPDTESKTVQWTEIPDEWQGFDIGEKTIEMFKENLKGAKTVIWNGPVGVFEFEQFAIGTNSIASILAELNDATTIIGGGDSASAVEKAGLANKMTHISTGGGASLEFLEGKKLPGVECLDNQH